MTAAALVQQVREAGGTIRATATGLRLSAPAPLPRRLIEELRAHKAELLAYLCDSPSTLRVYEYRLRRSKTWNIMLSPDNSVANAKKGLCERFGNDALVDVRRHTVDTPGL